MIWLAALALAQATPDASKMVMIYGPEPSPSCGAWTSTRANKAGTLLVGYQEWVLGLVTGFIWNSPSFRARGPDTEALFGWIDQYCATHPLDALLTAALGLSRELEKRAP